MARRSTMLLIALLVIGFVVSGCGDDNDDAATPTQETAPVAQPTATQPADASPAASGVPDTPEAKQAVESCKAQADANPQLSAEAKTKIGEVCEEAGSGDADGALKASREACEILVEDTVPDGAAKQTALDACKQSTTPP